MDNISHLGYTIDFSIITNFKDKKKYCNNPPNFKKDMEAFGRLIVGKYEEEGVLLGDIVRCGTEDVESRKSRFSVSMWNMDKKNGYRIYYFKYEKNIVLCHVYIKCKNNIKNETLHFLEIFKGRFL